MSEKKRLDCLLFDMGLAESREKAKTLIMMGQVYVDNQKSDKPGTPVSEDAKIEVRGGGLPYVSRGGLKLEKAMHTFDISLQRQGGLGYRCFYRWLYRLLFAKRCEKSIFH